MLTVLKAGAQKTDSLRFPIEDRRGDPFTWNRHNTFDISDTAYIKRSVEYDPATHQYYIVEKIGNRYYRKPTYLTFEEYWKLKNNEAEIAYFQARMKTLDDLNKKRKRPKMQVYNKLFDRIFGLDSSAMKVDIRPQGTVDLALGYQGQRIDNPSLPERARKTGGLDFDMNANLSVIANIGNKLKLPINYNTLANFDFENQMKLDYKGMDDEIIRSIEAGNISFQTKSSLVSGVQSLFGIKTQLQFGRLGITAAIANQRSEKKSATLSGGGSNTTISKKMDDYDENRNFLLAQYFRNNFNKAMGSLPIVSSQIKITRMEVWVTNRTGSTTNARYVVGLSDLGESSPANSANSPLLANTLPQNGSNDLYAYATSNATYRNSNYVSGFLNARGLTQINDFEKIYARKLTTSEYTFNEKVGFLCLSSQLQSADALAVSFQYTYNGKVYQVGEFSEDVTVDSTTGIQKVLFLKLLKATSQRVQLPIWNLMMKNVYSVGVTGVDSANFVFNIMYREASGGDKIYLPESNASVEGKSLLSILKLDRLNSSQNTIPDGLFDYISGYTILPAQGKIIFPVLEPFGDDLDTLAFGGMSSSVKSKYVYHVLYDSIKAIAQTYVNLDRFVASGSVKGTSTNSLSLGAFNIPAGSVTVRSGATTLKENVDYIVDYSLGTVTIINQALLASGTTITVDYESSSYTMQQRNFMGLRLDYKASDKLNLGATFEHLGTTPFYSKVNVGDDPISNSIYGVDFTYSSQSAGLTRMLNKLPNFSSTQKSTINASGEFAYLQPGHASAIGGGTSGAVYIDDFESASSDIDIRFPATNWALASTPNGNSLFPEAALSDSVDYNKNRAKLAWYTIEPTLQTSGSSSNPLQNKLSILSDPRMRAVYTTELFPAQSTTVTNVQLSTFDLSYYPTEKGPYNFETSTAELDANGKFKNPKTKWGGIMRSIDQSDFVTANIAYVEFWMQDPFIKNPSSTGGKLYLNLGMISEDILKDGKHFYENGLSTPTQNTNVDSTGAWGKTPVNPVQQTQAFSTQASDRDYQDVGLDGLNNTEERTKRASYLNTLLRNFASSSTLYQHAYDDPSGDDYVWYRDGSFTENSDILTRYKNYNNPQGNSPVASTSSTLTSAATNYPDNEDLNKDNVMNETESYYEYGINLTPGSLVVGSNYITDKRTVTPTLADGSSTTENWYLFRVPVESYTSAVGGISDFQSIQFTRMYLSGFEDSVVLRFGELSLVRNSWRAFSYVLDTTGSYTALSGTSSTNIDITSVGVINNGARTPVPYKIPPGINRVQTLSSSNTTVLEDEQSMSMKITNLNDGDARAVFKTMTLDVRKYGKLSMFVHAESVTGQAAVANNDLNLVVRIGQDFLTNYYEVKIPLTMTPLTGTATSETVWPTANNLDFTLQQLVKLKVARNDAGFSTGSIYRQVIDGKTFSVMGSPNLGDVGGILIAVENPSGGNTGSLNTEVWVDELRLSEIDEHGAWAAVGRLDMQLADLGTFTISGSTYSQGWGTVEQSVSQRSLNTTTQLDAALQLDAGKLLPSRAGITIPMYAGYSRAVSTPEYDPYNLDIKLKDEIKKSGNKKDSILNTARDISLMKTLTFTNVRFGKPKSKPKLWSLSNFDFTFAYTKTSATSSVISMNDIWKYRGGFGYTYNNSGHFIQPLKHAKWKTGWLQLLKDFNFNLTPTLISFRTDINRQFGMYTPRIVNTTTNTVTRVDTTYNKTFTFNRYYNFRMDLSRSLNVDFSATMLATIDEPAGKLDTKEKRDSVWKSFMRGGRPTSYQQKLSASYTLPLSKFPLTNWLNARYTYSAAYTYTSASLEAKYLGNTITNDLDQTITGEMDFTRLYSKWKWLERNSTPYTPKQQGKNTKLQPSKATSPTSKIAESKQVVLPKLPAKEEALKGLHGKARRKALRAWRKRRRELRRLAREQEAKKVHPPDPVSQVAATLITMVKRASISYTTSNSTYLPGYMDSTQFLGQNWKSMQPGMDFILGKQPDDAWLDSKARLGLLSADSTFNNYFQQNYSQQYNFTATIQPIKDFNIEMFVQKSFTQTYTELFKDTTGSGLHFAHLSGTATGGFSVSFISFETLFRKSNPSQVSETFKTFQNNRLIISERMARQNAYQDGTTSADGYYTGYGRYSQNVLIPAFVAAYTNKDPHKVALLKESYAGVSSNPFSGLKPMPNWNATYSGLSRLPMFSSIFSSIILTHAYSGTLGMNSYTTDLTFNDPLHLGTPGFIDTISGNFVPYYIVPNITIDERFSPLIGIDVTTLKQMNVHLKYNRSRTLSLSLSSYQLSEVQSSGWDFGLTWRSHGLNLPFSLPFMKPGERRLQNDIGLTVDVSYRRDAQSSTVLDENVTYVTGGQRIIKISPSVDYTLNKRINLTFYFDQQRSIPYVSTSSPITTTKGGVKIRISLAK